MTARTDGKDDNDRLIALLRANPGPDVSPRALFDAWVAARDDPFFDPLKISETARAATRAARTPDEPASRLKSRRTEGETLLMARTKELVQRLGPWLRQRRAVVFGQTRPPFTSLTTAAAWIERETGAAAPRDAGSASERRYSNRIDAVLLKLLDADPWSTYSVNAKDHWLDYWKPDGSPGRVRVSRAHRQLFGVYRTVTQVSGLTTLPSSTVAAWFLAGLQPSARVRLANGRTATLPGLQIVRVTRHTLSPATTGGVFTAGHVAQRVTLDLDVRDLRDRTFRVARREAASRLRPRSPVTPKQRRVAEQVLRLGGPPSPKFSRVFWTRVAKLMGGDADPIAVAKLFYRSPKVDGKRP
jgi:hypothetical protein